MILKCNKQIIQTISTFKRSDFQINYKNKCHCCAIKLKILVWSKVKIQLSTFCNKVWEITYVVLL